MTPVSEAGNGTRITSTTTLMTGTGSLLGIFVASASATPTITISDGATTLVNTFTPAGASWYTLPFRFGTSLIVTISGTVDCTVSWAGS